MQKNLEATILFVDFVKAFDSIHRGKMEQILLPYSLPKEAVAAIMMLYRNKKSKSPLPGWRHRLFRHCSRFTLRRRVSSIPLSKLKATSQEERIQLRKQHFENLSGKPLKVIHELITRILSKQLDIKLGACLERLLIK